MNNILQYPDPVLRQKSKIVRSFDSELHYLLKELLATMKLFKGIGLSAIQIGLPIKVFVVDTKSSGINIQEFINPEIIFSQGKFFLEEGCLSIPGIRSYIKRANIIKVHFQDRFGTKKLLELSALQAAVVQHETDHLNGILFLDRLSFIKKQYYKFKYKKNANR